LARRLRGRASDEPAEIERRMKAARDEIAHWAEFDHVIVNEELDRAVSEARAILVAARLRTVRQIGLPAMVASFGVS
jgi:guanylate kinase